MEAHVLTARLTHDIEFPYLALLVSGGHTQLLYVTDMGHYHVLGTTLDDALGECFDKSAKLMGLGYPGGPALEKMALACDDPDQAIVDFPLPTPMKGKENADFSFSGLKSAVRNHIDKMPDGDLEPIAMARLAYAFQAKVADILHDRCAQALEIVMDIIKADDQKIASLPFVVCGGVAANKFLRNNLEVFCKNFQGDMALELIAPPLKLCSDNGVMIAWTGLEKLTIGNVDGLDIAARPRWPLDQ